jgi:outer membrane protein
MRARTKFPARRQSAGTINPHATATCPTAAPPRARRGFAIGCLSVCAAFQLSLQAGTATPPDESMPLELEDAVLMALDANPDLQVQAFGPLIAGTFLQRERARFSPELFAEASQRGIRSAETDRATGETFDSEIEQLRLRGGINQTLSTGTDITLAASQTADSSTRVPDQEEARLSLSFTQALLQGAGRQVNLAGVEKARLDLEISEAELRAYTESLLASVERAYWRFWLAGETIAIASQALEVAEKQLADMQQRIAVGQLARNEEAVARAEVARRRQTLIDARADTIKRRIELLALIAPHQLDATYHPVTIPETPDEESDTSIGERIALAETSRSDLQEARLRLQQRRLDTVVTRNGRLPRLDFFAELDKAGYGTDMGAAWSDLGGNRYDVQAGLRLRYTPGQSADKARDAEARFRQEQAEAAIENLRLQIASRVRIARYELRRAIQQIEASAETRQHQQSTVEAEVERFQVGAGTALLVAQAQRDLLAVLIAEKQAIVQARLALLDLYLAEGSFLDRRGITTETPEGQ